MSASRAAMERASVEPLDPQIRSIQPGGGACMRIELAWGCLRRWYLKRFRPRYVEKMRQLRRGEQNRCPHEVLDPRDVKFYRNQGGYWWSDEDDPFRWRERLPLARVGLGEVVILGGGCLVLAIVFALLWWPAALLPLLGAFGVVWFFRDPPRRVPEGPGLVVAPADGKVVAVEEVEQEPYVGGRAVVISIFLSIFNVHLNRCPLPARVIGLSYRPGKFLGAFRPEAARENEQMTIRLEENQPPYRRVIVRQVAGAVARRIVCWVRPGEELLRGEKFGMIKFGSRTELVLPHEPDLSLEVRVGQTVRAGQSVVARFSTARGACNQRQPSRRVPEEGES